MNKMKIALTLDSVFTFVNNKERKSVFCSFPDWKIEIKDTFYKYA